VVAAVPRSQTAMPSVAATVSGPARKGLIDLHTHAIAPSLPDLAAVAPWAHWPSVQQSSETRARILVDGHQYRDIDSRCRSAGRRLADMDAEGVALQVVSPVPVTFCHDAPADGAAVLARAQNDFRPDWSRSGRTGSALSARCPCRTPAWPSRSCGAACVSWDFWARRSGPASVTGNSATPASTRFSKSSPHGPQACR
jgi:hypothetical protein